MRIPKVIIVLLISELIRFSLYANQVDKDLLHRIDDLLLRRMSVVSTLVEEDNKLDNNDNYNKNIETQIDYCKSLNNYFVEKYNILSRAKIEIDACCQEIGILYSSYPKNQSNYDLISSFNIYFDIYKTYINSMHIDKLNQIRTAQFNLLISSIEINQNSLFEALDNSDIKTAQKLIAVESNYIELYQDYFNSINFNSRIPKAWGNEFKTTYAKMHEQMNGFLRAKILHDEPLYERLRIQGFDIIAKIPLEKSLALKHAMEDILFGSNSTIKMLKEKSLQAAKKAYELYFMQKMQIGEYPQEIDSIGDKNTNIYFELIRKLVKIRILNNPELREMYASGEVPRIESMSNWELMGIPEATIVTIIETYWTIKKATNKNDIEILNHIENERRIMFPESTSLPTILTLFSYMKYRLRIEHPPPVTQINDSLLKEMIDIANNVYGYKQ